MQRLAIWPLFVNPQTDELLSSWLTRVAHSHHQKIYTFYRSGFKDKSRIWNIDIDRTERIDLLELISKWSNTSLKDVQACTLNSLEGRLFLKKNIYGYTRWILPLGIYHSKRKRPGLMYCPSCLNKDEAPYYRKKWRLALSVVCPDCHIWLKDRCAYCGQIVCFTRHELGKKNIMPNGPISMCFNCGHDLRNVKCEPADDFILEKQRLLYQYIDKGHTDYINYSHLYFDALYQLLKVLNSDRKKSIPLQIAISSELNIKYGYINNFSTENFEYKEVFERGKLLRMALSLLENWPERFIGYCKDTKTSPSLLFKDAKSSDLIPFWYYSIIDRNLSNRIVSSGER